MTDDQALPLPPAPRRFWWQFWRKEPWWLPLDEYDQDLPYGGSRQRLDPDLWDYGRKSGWW